MNPFGRAGSPYIARPCCGDDKANCGRRMPIIASAETMIDALRIVRVIGATIASCFGVFLYVSSLSGKYFIFLLGVWSTKLYNYFTAR
jgi:hypothetical protein